jgi:hypothetical protein
MLESPPAAVTVVESERSIFLFGTSGWDRDGMLPGFVEANLTDEYTDGDSDCDEARTVTGVSCPVGWPSFAFRDARSPVRPTGFSRSSGSTEGKRRPSDDVSGG